jgi:hypothetical protein
LLITNPNTEVLPSGYTIRLELDTANLIGDNKLQADGDDLRLVWVDGTTPVELHRVTDPPFNSNNAVIWFRTQQAIPANSDDLNYYLYYGNPSAPSAPADPVNVFTLWDGFEGTTLNTNLWTVANGSVSISNGYAHLDTGTTLLGQTAFTYAIIESSVQLGAAEGIAWWGWEEDASVDSANAVIFEGLNDAPLAWTRSNWADTILTLASPPGGLTAPHTYTIDWSPGEAFWWLDGALRYDTTTNVPSVSLYPNFSAYSFPVDVDWVRIRLRTPTEPTASLCEAYP